MDICTKDEPTAKKSAWNESFLHLLEKLKNPLGSVGGGGWHAFALAIRGLPSDYVKN